MLHSVITESLLRQQLLLLHAAGEVFDWRSVWSFHGNICVFAAGNKQVIRNFNDIVKIKNSV